MDVSRRTLLTTLGGASLWSTTAIAGVPGLWAGLPDGTRDEVTLEALPGKRPLYKLTYRPPNYETPLSYFDSVVTPNDAFFVRYHLADIPELAAAAWQLTVNGDGASTPITLTLDDLKRDYPKVSVTAVCQCSGNRRGLAYPHVPGVQWGPGAMGNAVWSGVRLKDILAKVGIKPEAVELFFQGADRPVAPGTPEFIKSLPVAKGNDENVLIAYEMNGAPLPHFNGYPARLVVPGWTATYWMKHLTRIQVSTKPCDNFWMAGAYRVPQGKFPTLQRFATQDTAANTPITEILVNSLITNLEDGRIVKAGKTVEAKGVAWDGGYEIDRVVCSSDGGRNWHEVALGPDMGRYSFRTFTAKLGPFKPGRHVVMVAASNKAGQTQVPALITNPAGYHHNVIQSVTLVVA